MIRFRILDCCNFCDGEAFIFIGEDVDADRGTFDWYHLYKISREGYTPQQLLLV